MGSPLSALQEAQDIFGLEFDLSEFDADGGFDDIADDDDDDEEATPEEKSARHKSLKAKRKGSRKSIYQVIIKKIIILRKYLKNTIIIDFVSLYKKNQ